MSENRMLDLIKFPDCSALTDRGRCTRLSVATCQGKGCSFKRTFKEDMDSINYVYQRLSSLDISIQSHIAKKYYRGSMPWKAAKPVKTYGMHRELEYLKDSTMD